MKKEIKEVQFVLENCESITVPYQCFSNFEFTIDTTNDRYIRTLNCVIKDSGNIEYGTYSDNTTSPIKRLSEYGDICDVNITYNDKSKEEYCIIWYDDRNGNSNDNQTSELIDYRTINIKIAPHIPKYSLADTFEFAVGEVFQGEEDKAIIKIEWDINRNKFISNITKLTEQQVRQSYIRVS